MVIIIAKPTHIPRVSATPIKNTITNRTIQVAKMSIDNP